MQLSDREIRNQQERWARSNAINQLILEMELLQSEARLHKIYACISTLALVIYIVKTSFAG